MSDQDQSDESEEPSVIEQDTIEDTNRVRTGIENLDRFTGGGILEGSLVAFLVDPVVPGDFFLSDFISVRPSVYFTTTRSPDKIDEIYNTSENEIRIEDVRSPDHVRYTPTKTEIAQERDLVISYTKTILEQAEQKTFIFDTFSDYIGRHNWDEILYEISDLIMSANSIAYLYLLREPSNDLNKVLRACDTIFELRAVRQQMDHDYHLTIPKIRGTDPLDRILRLNITQETGIRVDTSTEV